MGALSGHLNNNLKPSWKVRMRLLVKETLALIQQNSGISVPTGEQRPPWLGPGNDPKARLA